MLLEQQRVWWSYPDFLKAHFHAIVTDDCSPRAPAREVFAPTGIASQQLYRVHEQRRWDWLVCRNLGVEKAKTDWVLLTDIDHVLPESTLRALMVEDWWTGHQELDISPKGATRPVRLHPNPSYIYRFSRVDAHHPFPWAKDSLTPYKEHPNSWLMTRGMFDQMGGYDERFSGYYGSDSDFRERCKMIPENAATQPAAAVVRLDYPLVRYPREVIPDASTTTYERKAREDGIHVPRIKAARVKISNWRPLRVTIPYNLEASS